MRGHHWIAISAILFFAFGFAAWILIIGMSLIMLTDDIARYLLHVRRPVRPARKPVLAVAPRKVRRDGSIPIRL